jgi:hypothetical protein
LNAVIFFLFFQQNLAKEKPARRLGARVGEIQSLHAKKKARRIIQRAFFSRIILTWFMTSGKSLDAHDAHVWARAPSRAKNVTDYLRPGCPYCCWCYTVASKDRPVKMTQAP